MKKYCEIRDIENYLLTEIESSFTGQIEKWIEAMTLLIDRKTGRSFIADDSFSVKFIDGSGTSELIVGDFVELDNAKIEGGEVGVHKLPANETPYWKIATKDGLIFPRGRQNIEVKAKWGYSEEVPEDIKFATAVLVSGIIQQSLDHEGEVANFTMGRYSVSYKDDKQITDKQEVDKMLESYKRYYEV